MFTFFLPDRVSGLVFSLIHRYKGENMKHKYDKNKERIKSLHLLIHSSVLKALFFDQTVFLFSGIICLVVEEK